MSWTITARGGTEVHVPASDPRSQSVAQFVSPSGKIKMDPDGRETVHDVWEKYEQWMDQALATSGVKRRHLGIAMAARPGIELVRVGKGGATLKGIALTDQVKRGQAFTCYKAGRGGGGSASRSENIVELRPESVANAVTYYRKRDAGNVGDHRFDYNLRARNPTTQSITGSAGTLGRTTGTTLEV